ncbi:MAG TPA: hypothetical protein VMU01_11175 [Rhizomicrobium sp.]|nr:hypothetical protein [Rhizomicrobium sp.]
MASKLRAPLILSGAVAVLAAASSVVPFFVDLYRRDPPFALGAQQGTDLVTLILGVPLLVTGMVLTMRGSARGILFWIGMLEYMLYTFVYFLLGAQMNELFLVYAAICALSLLAVISAMNNAWLTSIGSTFRRSTPARRVSLFMFLFAAVLAALWTYLWHRTIFEGADAGMPAEAFHLIASVDLTIFVPIVLVVAAMLWRRTPMGYAQATSVMVMSTIYPLVLIASAPFQANAGVEGAWTTVPLWAAMSAGSLLCAFSLLRNMQNPKFG